MSEIESYQDDMTGYISVKDYAYDESNPLHFGYIEEDNPEEEEIDDVSDNLRMMNTKSILLPDEYVVNRKAVAIYPFVPENDNELELKEGDLVYISYKHGQGWLVAENRDRTRTGLVPEEYVSLLDEESDEEFGNPRPFYLTQMITDNIEKSVRTGDDDDEWEDVESVSDDDEDEIRPTYSKEKTFDDTYDHAGPNSQESQLMNDSYDENALKIEYKEISGENEEVHDLQRRLQENLEI